MKKEVKTFLSHITLRSFFYVEEIGEGIYRNDESEGLFYLETSHETDWPVFEKLITYQKLTGDFRNFDAAIGYWIDKPAFIDFIRIYSRSIDTMKLAEIRNTYHRNMEDLLEKRIMI